MKVWQPGEPIQYTDSALGAGYTPDEIERMLADSTHNLPSMDRHGVEAVRALCRDRSTAEFVTVMYQEPHASNSWQYRVYHVKTSTGSELSLFFTRRPNRML